MKLRDAGLLAGGVALVYAPVLTAPVLYDDASHVRDNPVFALPFGEFLSGLFSRDYFAFARERTYQPLVTLFHYFTHAHPAVYRSAGLLLHAVNAALVFEIARRLTGKPRSAVLAAFLFAFFPLQAEALNLSAFKGHILAAFFAMAVVLAVMEGLTAGVLLALALVSKESGLVAVPLAAAYAALFQRGRQERLKAAGVVFAALTGLYLAFRFLWLAPPPPFPVAFEYSSWRTLAFYVRDLVLPYPACLERTLPAGPWFLLWLGLLAGAFWRLRKSREASFALAWIVAGLLPVLHWIPFSNVSPVADRYLYLPAAGLSLLLVLVAKGPRAERALALLGLVWAGMAFSRNLTYRSERALFEQTAVCAPDNARAHFLAGNARFKDKDYPAARASYERVLSLTESAGARDALLAIDRLEKK